MNLSGGFRTWLEKAVRIEDEGEDWSLHTVDYWTFKTLLKQCVQRRMKLRTLLRESEDHCITQAVLEDVLFGGNSKPTIRSASSRVSGAASTTPCESGYIPFNDGELMYQSSSDDDNRIIPSPHTNTSQIQASRRRNHRSVMRHTSVVERNEINEFLTLETIKAHLFYTTQWQRLETWMNQSEKLREDEHYSMGTEILELLAFCVINIITVRQILIRYDAFARAFEGTPMLQYYIKRVLKESTPYRDLLFHEEVMNIADQYQKYLMSSPSAPEVLEQFQAQLVVFSSLLTSSESAGSIHTDHTAAGTRERQQRSTMSLLYTIRDWYLLGAFEDKLGLEPACLTMRGLTLNFEMAQLAEWRISKHESRMLLQQRPVKQLSEMQTYHLTLNLLSAFLFCMNYYIVEPSSTMYCNRLGAYDAMSGSLIGMMPLAAFVSSIPYSMWTNYSFRYPFIMSCFLLMSGNLVYSLADRNGSIKIALLGRFICGLGAPKCIIRRYMADTTPVALRTSVNAGFGMVVAAGSAMGPAMAILLNRVEYVFAVPYLGVFIFNGLTLPGYFMASLWFTFTLIVLATFEEPDREGLLEQQALEQTSRCPDHDTVIQEDDSLVVIQQPLHPVISCEKKFFGSDLVLPFETDWSRQSNTCNNKFSKFFREVISFFQLITTPVCICLSLLFAKVFTIESLVSATSALSKNRYNWKVQQVGTLGFVNGLLVIPFSIMVGRLSMSYQDHVLMRMLVVLGSIGLFLLIDLTDFRSTPTETYNEGERWAVSPQRYIAGYFLAYVSIQSFEGVIGSTLSKVIPTALASGTINSGLLATLVDTFGRACGDLFISAMGYISLRQLMNLLFLPTFVMMLTCLFVIHQYKDLLSV